jgi:hypothetical protein
MFAILSDQHRDAAMGRIRLRVVKVCLPACVAQTTLARHFDVRLHF